MERVDDRRCGGQSPRDDDAVGVGSVHGGHRAVHRHGRAVEPAHRRDHRLIDERALVCIRVVSWHRVLPHRAIRIWCRYDDVGHRRVGNDDGSAHLHRSVDDPPVTLHRGLVAGGDNGVIEAERVAARGTQSVGIDTLVDRPRVLEVVEDAVRSRRVDDDGRRDGRSSLCGTGMRQIVRRRQERLRRSLAVVARDGVFQPCARDGATRLGVRPEQIRSGIALVVVVGALVAVQLTAVPLNDHRGDVRRQGVGHAVGAGPRRHLLVGNDEVPEVVVLREEDFRRAVVGSRRFISAHSGGVRNDFVRIVRGCRLAVRRERDGSQCQRSKNECAEGSATPLRPPPRRKCLWGCVHALTVLSCRGRLIPSAKLAAPFFPFDAAMCSASCVRFDMPNLFSSRDMRLRTDCNERHTSSAI